MSEKVNLDAAFSTKMRGYDKAEVNDYIEKLMTVSASEKDALQKTVTDLRNELAQTKNDTDQVVKKYNELYQAGDSKAKAVEEKYEAMVSEAAQQLIVLRNRVSELSAENEKLKQGSDADVENATRSLKAALDEKNQAIDSLHEQIATLNKQIGNMSEAQGQAKAAHEAEVNKDREDLAKAAAEAEEAKKTAESYKKQLSEGEIGELKKSVKTLTDSLAEQKQAGERLMAENASLKKHSEQLAEANKAAADSIVDLQKQLTDAKAAYAKQAGYIEGLIHELETAYSAKLRADDPGVKIK